LVVQYCRHHLATKSPPSIDRFSCQLLFFHFGGRRRFTGRNVGFRIPTATKRSRTGIGVQSGLFPRRHFLLLVVVVVVIVIIATASSSIVIMCLFHFVIVMLVGVVIVMLVVMISATTVSSAVFVLVIMILVLMGFMMLVFCVGIMTIICLGRHRRRLLVVIGMFRRGVAVIGRAFFVA
jgi:hypothetical protein